jgi:tetratricopeptide (TPR) repeat protein
MGPPAWKVIARWHDKSLCYPFFMKDESAYSLLQKGRELLEAGNPAQAAVVLERARIVEPRKGSILELLGRAYFGYGRYGRAAECFEEALAVDPTNDYAHYCLGLCCLKLKKPEEARAHIKLAWFLNPGEEYRQKAARYGLVETDAC